MNTQETTADDGFDYLVELFEADEISEEKFVDDARWLGHSDFELAVYFVDNFSEEVHRGIHANLSHWYRRFNRGFGDICTHGYESKTFAFDAALRIVAGRFGLTLPPGSGRCRPQQS